MLHICCLPAQVTSLKDGDVTEQHPIFLLFFLIFKKTAQIFTLLIKIITDNENKQNYFEKGDF